MEEQIRIEVEAAAFRRPVDHLRGHTEARNIGPMNLAGLCRDRLSKWHRAAAGDRGVEMRCGDAREIVSAMPCPEWKSRRRWEATRAQQAACDAKRPKHG